jgi:hypothetical protein
MADAIDLGMLESWPNKAPLAGIRLASFCATGTALRPRSSARVTGKRRSSATWLALRHIGSISLFAYAKG